MNTKHIDGKIFLRDVPVIYYTFYVVRIVPLFPPSERVNHRICLSLCVCVCAQWTLNADVSLVCIAPDIQTH